MSSYTIHLLLEIRKKLVIKLNYICTSKYELTFPTIQLYLQDHFFSTNNTAPSSLVYKLSWHSSHTVVAVVLP